MSHYVLAIDQGTTSCRTIAFDRDGKAAATAQREFAQYYPQPGWVEHDADEIWSVQAELLAEAASQVGERQISAIGITNQRETVVVWDRATGKPLHRAIVWQCRRTSDRCAKLREEGFEPLIRSKTGLLIDPYFSASKLAWLLDELPGLREMAETGEALFGTIDSWLLWKLTDGAVHATDVSNASRTMLFNIHTLEWDEELLDLFRIPRAMLPAVRSCSEVYGYTVLNGGVKVPIAGAAGDQQAALFGQACLSPGMVKNTYGTGCFLLANTGERPVSSAHGLLTTVAWTIQGQTHYALEGSVFTAGAAVQWLRDGLGIVGNAAESEALAASVPDAGGVTFVPAFTGLGTPYWNADARGMIAGLTRGTTAAHIAYAALEAMAQQTADVLEAIAEDSGIPLTELRVDGGAVSNGLLMQMQADLLGVPVLRPRAYETTALGAAALAGLATGFWSAPSELFVKWQLERRFDPARDEDWRERQRHRWKRTVSYQME